LNSLKVGGALACHVARQRATHLDQTPVPVLYLASPGPAIRLTGMSFLHLGLGLLLLANLRLGAESFAPLTDAERLLPPTAPRLEEFVRYAEQGGWDKFTPLFRAAAQTAYASGRLPAAERWSYVYRWSELFAETEAHFIPHWMKEVEAAKAVHANLPRRYAPQKERLGLWLSPALKTWLLTHPEFSGEFFALLSPVDYLPEVFHLLDGLHGRDPARFARYARLALAIAVVYDLPPPPDWPHGQVYPASFPRPPPAAADAFDWWIRQDQLDRTYHPLERLGADDLKFVVDAAAPFNELEWSQRNVDLPLAQLDKAYTLIRYRPDRAAKEIYLWPDGAYTLSDIRRVGGICIDQAYFATQVGKARAVPTLLFRGEGMDGRHAWFGYLADNLQWQLNAGRYGEQRFVTGYARDPQTWKEISAHELQFLSERFRTLPAFHRSRIHQQFAADYLQAKDPAAAIRAAWRAIKWERRNLDAWNTLLDAQAVQGDTPKQIEATLYQAIAAFGNYADLEAAFSGRLCRSLRARGQLSAADFESQRILAKNRLARTDLALLQATDSLQQTMDTRPLAEGIKAYDKLVDTQGRGAGIAFYDKIVTPFVRHMLENQHPTEARQAAKRARAMLYVPPGSQLDGEFNKLFKELKAVSPAAQR